MKSAWWLVVVSVLSLPAVWPLLTVPFFASDDGLFHLYRLAALDDALRQGVLYPRLFPSFAFGYGQAVFSYYGPLSYYLAELIHLLSAAFPDSIKWTFALGYVGAGWAAFALARQFVPPLPALLGAVAYMYFPYHLAETYQRGALAEHLAFVWLPLVLWGATPLQIADCRLQIGGANPGVGSGVQLLNPEGAGVQLQRQRRGQRRARTLVFVLSLAALILTHSLTAMIFLPFVVLYYFVIRWDLEIGSRKLEVGSWKFGVGLALALGLTAFYWLPVLTQSRWVGLSAGLDNEGYRAHLAPVLSFVQPSLVFQYAPQQLVAADHPLGLLSFFLLLGALVVLVRSARTADPSIRLVRLFVGLSIAALFMMLELSLPIWQALHNPLSFLQYPWRFMALAALGVSLSVAIMIGYGGRQVHAETGTQGSKTLLPCVPVYLFPCVLLIPLLILTAIAVLPLKPLPTPAADKQAMWQNDFQQRQIGATWTAEYMPWWVRADRTAIPSAARAPSSEVSLPAPLLTLVDASYTLRRYRVQPPPQPSPTQSAGEGAYTLRFHQFYLPQWRVTLNGQLLSTFPSTDLGLLSVDLSPLSRATGEGSGVGAVLELDFGLSDSEQLAMFISLTSLVIVAGLFRGRWLLGAGMVLLLVGLLFAAQSNTPILWGTGQPTNQPTNYPTIQSINTQLENIAELVAVRTERNSYHAGDSVRITLTWLARRETRENFKGFVHLLRDARVIAQSDGDPVGGFTPTSQWRTGEFIEDTRVLQIPNDTPPGKLSLFTGLYRFPSLKNLATLRDGHAFSDDRIPIGEIQVVER